MEGLLAKRALDILANVIVQEMVNFFSLGGKISTIVLLNRNIIMTDCPYCAHPWDEHWEISWDGGPWQMGEGMPCACGCNGDGTFENGIGPYPNDT